MKKIFCFIMVFTIMSAFNLNAQSKFKGIVKDSKDRKSIYGAVIRIVSPNNNLEEKTSVDFDGTFKISSVKAFGTIEVSMNGYITKEIPFYKTQEETLDLGTIYLEENLVVERDVIVTTSSIDVIKDRKTPISSSTMRNYEMREKISDKDFIELTNNMPGVYTSRVGGGFGDSRINVRGFEQNNISPMIDGIPVYDLEAGIVDWANLTSMNDVTSSIQLQRGLGASKLVNSSVAGTMNMILRDANHPKGGFLYNSTGNNGFRKFGASYATGRSNAGLSANIFLSAASGEGYVNATDFEAYTYYVALGFNKGKHDFQFKVFGSPQWHNQRVTDIRLSEYLQRGNGTNDPNIRFNRDWGYLDGKEYGTKVNFGHKPLGILQWDYNVSDKTQFSMKLYGSKGNSGETNFSGGIFGYGAFDWWDDKGQIDLNFIRDYNSGLPATWYDNGIAYGPFQRTANYNGAFINSIWAGSGSNTTSGITLVSEVTNQTFYGGIANFKTQLAKNLTLNFGLDGRKTVYNKTRIINDLFGASGYDINFYETPNYGFNTNNEILQEPKFDFTKKFLGGSPVDYLYDAKISYAGTYAQLEYDFWNLNFLLQGGFNRQFIQRIGYTLGKYEESVPGSGVYDLNKNTSDATGETSMDGYNVKFGINYNITRKHNLWANAGYVSRPPVFVTVYSGLDNVINPYYKNEKFESIEVGYGFRSRHVGLNISAYSSKHDDAEIPYYTPELGNFGTTSGINRINKGIEMDVTVAPIRSLILKGTVSMGDWRYRTNAIFYDLRPNSTVPVSELFVKDHKIGGAPQLMAGLGVNYELFTNFVLGANVKYNDKMYASPSIERYDPNFYGIFALTSPVRLPDFTVTDFMASYKFDVNVSDAIYLNLNIDNFFNRKYVNEMNSSYQPTDIDPSTYDSTSPTNNTYQDNGNVYNGIVTRNTLFWGLGRTWNFNVRYEF